MKINYKCVVCETINLKCVQKFEIATSYICNNCNSIINNPSINTDLVYDANYYEENYSKIFASQMYKSDKIIKQLSTLIHQNTNILDYGCGMGVFLLSAYNHGFKKCVGIDVSPDAIKLSNELNKDNDNRFFLNKEFDIKEKFDTVAFIDSIGHIKDINKIFHMQISNNLQKKGIVLIRTPRLNNIYLIYVKIMLKIAPQRYIKSLLFVPQRYIIFNQKSIALFLQKFDLEILSIECENDYKTSIEVANIKVLLKSLLRKIPELINNKNSMLVFARKRL